METPEIRRVVDVWVDQFNDLAARDFINYVQVFENRGAVMGCSNPHPHCQIWSNSSIPNEIRKECDGQLAWFEAKGSPLLSDYLARELATRERIVVENESFVTLVPFWAIWPFETMVLPKRHVTGLDQLTGAERDALADILKRTTTKYDNLFEVSFPYSAGFHQRPVDGKEHKEWQLHMHFYPPLLRSATVKKFMVGYEFLAYPQRDITAESAAQRLRELSDVHYTLSDESPGPPSQ
jgi:UDPglucose--hexose-1-phosphate uridylyltransferase